MSDPLARRKAVAPVARVLWSRLIWRHWKREPRLTLLLIGILALGVAVFLSVRLANKAAVSGFGLFTESLAGESDFILRPASGRFDATILREIRRATGSNPVAMFPVLEFSAVAEREPEGRPLKIVGADLVALQSAAGQFHAGSGEEEGTGAGAATRAPSTLGAVDRGWVAPALARRFGLGAGERLDLLVDDQSIAFTVAGVLPEDPNLPSAPDNLVVMDLPGAQGLAGHVGEISRVEFRVPGGAREDAYRLEAAVAVSRLAGERGWILERPEDRKGAVTQMSAAFRMNLAILSGLALLVGMYLIMQAMEAAVVKRRAEIAILRSLGVTSGQIHRAWLLEGVVLGFAGGLAGLVLGRLLAEGMVGAIARTVNTMYYETTTAAVRLEWGEVVFSLSFSLLASVVAVSLPAGEASRTPAARTMREGTQGGGLSVLRKTGLGLVLFALGVAAAFLPPRTLTSGTTVPVGGYLAAVLLVLSASVLIGVLFRPVAALLGFDWRGGGRSEQSTRREAMRRYAASQLRRPEGRHRLTAAGLAVAIGMSAAMGILVASFEHTLTSWIGHLLKADIYVSAAGAGAVSDESTLSEATWKELAGWHGVAGVDTLRRYRVTISGKDVFLGGGAYNDDPQRYLQLIWLDPPDERGPKALENRISGNSAAGRQGEGSRETEAFPGWISESFARRFGAAKGDRIPLPTPKGKRSVEVKGVFAEYGNETGTMIVARRFTREWFGDDSISDLAIYVEEGQDAEGILESMQEAFPAIVLRSNERLRRESIRIFHQTFAVTYALELIAVTIAVSGLGLALAGLLLERREELSTLRSLGASRKEIAFATMGEGIGLAAVGLAGGFLLSFALGWILIEVINPQSFGWTLRYRVPWASFALLALVTVFAAALVGRGVGSRHAALKSDRRES